MVEYDAVAASACAPPGLADSNGNIAGVVLIYMDILSAYAVGSGFDLARRSADAVAYL